MISRRKSVALKNLSIHISELEINNEDRESLIGLVAKATEMTAKGLLFNHFWEKVNFIRSLLLRMKEMN